MRRALLLSALAVFVPGAASAQVEFYQEGNRLYQESDFEGALSSYLRVVEAGFMSDSAESELLQRGVSPDAIQDYLECLGACDRARFAPPGSGDEERAGFFERTAKAMTAVQEGLS